MLSKCLGVRTSWWDVQVEGSRKDLMIDWAHLLRNLDSYKQETNISSFFQSCLHNYSLEHASAEPPQAKQELQWFNLLPVKSSKRVSWNEIATMPVTLVSKSPIQNYRFPHCLYMYSVSIIEMLIQRLSSEGFHNPTPPHF